ncbi:uncharacterized protein LOC130385789 [Gadus chalcogrammus]|uniref:uncharacterized protein LOC130385789 n=1 Tax=Gadus chalcogrammus TaxID=1042646 RepID=UPI0024C26375|nr:uncharacterized protein LOC130385789 [Gadus chalcogrammus]
MAAENKPEGLKKVRNPDRMYRTAVCYAGHGPPKSISDDTEMNNEHGHLKIYLPKKLLECLPKCSSLPKERHRWNTNEELETTYSAALTSGVIPDDFMERQGVAA